MNLLDRCATCRGPRGLHMTKGCVCAGCARTPCRTFNQQAAAGPVKLNPRPKSFYLDSWLLGRVSV